MINRIRFTGLFIATALLPVLAFAQEEPGPDPEPGPHWLFYAAVAINSLLIPIAVDLLRPLWKTAPAIVKTIVPVLAGVLLPLAQTFVDGVFPMPIDLNLLDQIWTGALMGAAASTGYKFGDRTGLARHGGRK